MDLLRLSFFLMGFLLSTGFFFFFFLFFWGSFFFFLGYFFLWVLSSFSGFERFLYLFEIKCKKLEIHVFLNSTIKNSRSIWH